MGVRTGESLLRLGLNDALKRLRILGCYPGLYYRGGGVWRAHVNVAGTRWDEDGTPLAALRAAIRQWERNDRKLDGMATDQPHPTPRHKIGESNADM